MEYWLAQLTGILIASAITGPLFYCAYLRFRIMMSKQQNHEQVKQ